MSESLPAVFVIDDDKSMRDSLEFLIRSIDLPVWTFDSARSFLESFDPDRAGCVVSDVRMPSLSGLDLLDQLRGRGARIPVVLITAHADVPMAVRALKAGAFDFIEKPFNDQILLDAIQNAMDKDHRGRHDRHDVVEIQERLATLTPREREVLDLVSAGELNKVIASQLGVTQKTVEAHRAKVMEKMNAESVAQLVRMILRAEPEPPTALS